MISIIGAGPAGLYAAELLAKRGYQVRVYEEHKKIGLPVQCTGLVTSSIERIVDIPKSCIVNRISKVKIYSPDGNHLNLRFKKPNLILDRHKFDSHLATRARKAGAKIILGKRIENIKDLDKGVIIGADGPNSMISKSLKNKTGYWIGLQYKIRYENGNAIEFFPYIGTFAWIVPESKTTARVGIVTEKNPKELLEKFLKHRIGKYKIIETHAGLIPKFNPLTTFNKDNLFIVGDAASLVKATTAGGLIQGLTSAQILEESITDEKNFNTEIRSKMFKELTTHLYMRKIFDKFTDSDWNKLIRKFQKPRLRNPLEEFDRDYPSRLALKLIWRDPSLLYFLKFIL